jgi:hypothetical protein
MEDDAEEKSKYAAFPLRGSTQNFSDSTFFSVINYDELTMGKQLGHGSFGVVLKGLFDCTFRDLLLSEFVGKWRNADCAIKQMLPGNGGAIQEKDILNFGKEAELMKRLVRSVSNFHSFRMNASLMC